VAIESGAIERKAFADYWRRNSRIRLPREGEVTGQRTEHPQERHKNVIRWGGKKRRATIMISEIDRLIWRVLSEW